MRTLMVSEVGSLDGVVQAAGGGEPEFRHEGWTFDIDVDPRMIRVRARGGAGG